MKKVFCVTVSRTGCIYVKADNSLEALDIANHQTDKHVNWTDDWVATDVEEVPSVEDFGIYCVTEREF